MRKKLEIPNDPYMPKSKNSRRQVNFFDDKDMAAIDRIMDKQAKDRSKEKSSTQTNKA